MPNLSREQNRLLQVLADEINHSLLTALQLPLPTDKRARKICYYLTEQPDDRQSQCALSDKFGLSPRTMTRLFIKETGMSFAHWRQQSKILYSLKLLERGESVTNVAIACGYENTGSYIAVFRQRFGQTPKAYFRHCCHPT